MYVINKIGIFISRTCKIIKMPYTIRKQSCTQSDGDKGTHVLSYTSDKGKKYNNCHTSKKKAKAQIAAIEAPPLSAGDEAEGDKKLLGELDRIASTFVSHSRHPRVGQSVVNVNPNCKHYASEGFVVSVEEMPEDAGVVCTYSCTNSGSEWEVGDALTKTLDQMAPLGVSEVAHNRFSSDLMYHHRRGIPVNENVFRPGSWGYFSLIREARDLTRVGCYTPRLSEARILNQTAVGEFAEYNGRLVPLDFPMPHRVDYNLHELKEAEYDGRDVDLNKPLKGDTKKYKVYVKNKKGNVIKVEFGDLKGGLTQQIQNMDRRRAFGKRHNCADKKDKTTPGYWSCRLPRYWKELGFKKPPNPNGEWW